MQIFTGALHLNRYHFRYLLENLGPSLGLWRAAEIATLREQTFIHPVLDLGCGDGLVTSMVLARVEIGLDPDPDVLTKAGRLGIYQKFEVVPAEETGLPDESISTVLSNSVLEHLQDVDGALQAAGRLLRPGGQFILTVPSHMFSRWLALPFSRYAAWRNQKLIHRNLWPVDRWAEHLQRAGLEIVSVRPYLRHSLVASWDALELFQLVWVGKTRLAGQIWKSLPPRMLDQIARLAAAADLSSPLPGGGCLITARKAN